MDEKLPNLLISTCGTSLWTNCADQPMRASLGKHSNVQESGVRGGDRDMIDRWLETRTAELCESSDKEAARLSAEINGLLGWYAAAGHNLDGDDIHWLVASDTYLGQRAAATVAAWLEDKTGQRPQCLSAKGLNTARLMDFRHALADMVKQFGELGLDGWRSEGRHVAFNLTGGFKSVNGFMQTLGMLFADECFYLFEGSSQVMRVPRLPLKFDAGADFRGSLQAVRRMARGDSVPRAKCGALSSSLLFEVDGECVLSEWGQALWEVERKALYGKRLMEPLSARLEFSKKFRSQGMGREGVLGQPKYLLGLNECLDALGALLDEDRNSGEFSGGRKQLKLLKGKPKGSRITHEFYIWNDARRGYGYFEDGKFVVDHIGDHL